MPETLRAAVAGATGYIGMQCVDLLDGHPGIELARLLGRSAAGRRYSDVVPGSVVELTIQEGAELDGCDIVFAALPHTVAAGQAQDWLATGAVLVDLSADFRLRDVSTWERWYGLDHPAPGLCEQAVYALPELADDALSTANLIAAPGCYPTAALLATVPALQAGLVEPDLVVDAKSGISGAGRSPSVSSLFAEADESVSAYGVAGHRHRAELEQELNRVTGADVRITFVPHLVPMTRGILATAYLRPVPATSVADIIDVYRDFCALHPCLRWSESPPATKAVTGTNVAALNVTGQSGMAVVTCAIDNLVRGAAGQAVQACNLRFGFEETAGLPLRSRWP